MPVDKLIVRTSLSVHQCQNLRLLRLCNGIRENNHFLDMNRIDGMPTKLEWKIFPGITTLGFLEKIQSLMRDLQCEPEHFIFMSMYNDIVWNAKGDKEQCEYNSQTVANYARKFPRGHWSFLELDQKRNGTEPTPTDLTDHGIQLAENMMANFSGSGHPIFRASSAFERGESRSKGHGKTLVLFNGSDENIELLCSSAL